MCYFIMQAAQSQEEAVENVSPRKTLNAEYLVR